MPGFFRRFTSKIKSKTKLLAVQGSVMDHFLAYFLFSDLDFSALVLFQRAEHAYKREGGILTFS